MGKEFFCQENWRKRFLPHYDAEGKIQVITYRLVDSLPEDFFSKMINGNAENKNTSSYRKKVEGYLAKGMGESFLALPSIAKVVIDAWLYFHDTRYELIAYVVMPNHVHLIVKTSKNWPLAKIVHSWKSFTAHEINKILTVPKKHIWQREYWDRFIRNEDHFRKALDYIHMNPVKAGLVDHPKDWQWSSYKAYFNHRDGDAPRS
jgi:putative transposase